METIIGFALMFALAMAAYTVSHMLVGGISLRRTERRDKPRKFPTVMPRQSHWARATSIVELSLTRAADMASHHANAARQLEAADYALHVLLGDLNQVMATSVMSPLVQVARPGATAMHMPSALAA